MLSVLLLSVYLVVGLPAAAFVFPWTWITKDTSLLFRSGFGITAMGLRFIGVRTVVTGRELVPANGACIFMANHVSNLDPPVLLPLMPLFSVIYLKQSLMKIPILGAVMRLAGFIPVRRDGTVEGARASSAAALSVLAAGHSVVIFPEGTRSLDGRLLPFKRGPFFLAIESGVPVVPVTLRGTESLMPKGSLRIRRGTAYVQFHSALHPAAFSGREELMDAVRQSIASGLEPTVPE